MATLFQGRTVCQLALLAGGLLSSHILLERSFSTVPGYDWALLRLATDLGNRLLPAFDTISGIPTSWVHLRKVRESGAACLLLLMCFIPLQSAMPFVYLLHKVCIADVLYFCNRCCSFWLPVQELGRHAVPTQQSETRLDLWCTRMAVQGVLPHETRFTCTACAGTLLLEFGTLSRLTGDPIYEQKARHAVKQVFGKSLPDRHGYHVTIRTA